MFVRKGTIRKGRGGANRRSANRRQKPEANDTAASPTFKPTTQDNDNSVQHGPHRKELSVNSGAPVSGRISPNNSFGVTKNGNTIPNRSSFGAEKSDGCHYTHSEEISLKETMAYIPEIQKLRAQGDSRGQNEIPKPSPSRSIATTVIVRFPLLLYLNKLYSHLSQYHC